MRDLPLPLAASTPLCFVVCTPLHLQPSPHVGLLLTARTCTVWFYADSKMYSNDFRGLLPGELGNLSPQVCELDAPMTDVAKSAGPQNHFKCPLPELSAVCTQNTRCHTASWNVLLATTASGFGVVLAATIAMYVRRAQQRERNRTLLAEHIGQLAISEVHPREAEPVGREL